ncbi:MAG: thioredoxin [Deltaproteobacteria bacterium]|nr:thioredoxin [Deltaproteobacteria bacterium]
MSEQHPENVTDADFEQKVLKEQCLVLVDFWAPWCGPCHNMAPALEAFAKSNAEKIRVYKLDVDDNPKTAEKYAIKSIPTLIFFKNGEPLDTVRGAASHTTLEEKLKAIQGI